MNKKPVYERVGDFMAGKGFYIVLSLCVAAIGVSGYYLFSSLNLSGGGGDTTVLKPTQVVVTPSVKPDAVKPPAPTQKPAVVRPAAPAATPAPKPKAAPAKQTAVYTWPVKGEVQGDFSLEVFGYDATMDDYRVHTAMDIAAEVGTQVKAMSAGTVTDIVQDDLMGTVVSIDHGEGLVGVYSNLAAQPTVAEGDKVTTGTVIGAVGETAVAESDAAAHLHFELLQDGDPIDPANFLPKA